MAIDLSKAIDTVNHTKLIAALSISSLHHNVIRWLSSYLRGRHAFCRYSEATSTCHAVRVGVPQGSVISPILFNFFVANYPENVELHTTYANDMHAAHSSTRPQEAADALTVHAESVRGWAEERDLQISTPKSFATLFTSDTHQSHLHRTVTLNNFPLPLERHPKLLGVTFDTHFFFAQHMLTVKKRKLNASRSSKHWLEQTWDSKKRQQ